MNPEYELRLLHCFICRCDLQDNPLYSPSVSKWCPNHGDYFVQSSRKLTPTLIFRPFEGPQLELSPLRRFTTNYKYRPTAEYKRRYGGRPSLILRCDQTGEVYVGLTAAAYGIDSFPHKIYLHLKGVEDNVNGYTFTRLDEFGDPLQ